MSRWSEARHETMRYSLRCFLTVLLVLSLCIGFVGNNYRHSRNEQISVQRLESLGARISRRPPVGWFGRMTREPCVVLKVSVSGARVESANVMRLVRDCRAATEVRLTSGILTGSDVRHLHSLPRLAMLDFSYCTFDAAATAEVAELRTLKALHLTGTGHSISLGRQNKVLGNLRLLDLSETKLRDDDIRPLLASYPALRSLRLRSTNTTDRALVLFADMPQLEEIDLGQTAVTGAGFRSAAAGCQLKTLLIPKTGDLGTPADHFGRAVSYIDMMEQHPPTSKEVNLDDLSALPRLRRLDVSGAVIMSGNANRRWRELEWIALSGSSLDDASAANLGEAPKLTHMGIADTAVTDAGLVTLFRRYPTLRCLDLRGTMISMNGLRAIANPTNLEEIYVSANRLNCSATALRAMLEPTNVKRVYVYDDPNASVAGDPEIATDAVLSILPDTYPLVPNYPIYWE